MESGKQGFRLATTTLAWLLVSGCTAMAPVVRQSTDAATTPDAHATHREVAVPVARAPLPRQAYTAAGDKVQYVAKPNPYTSGATAVPPEARSAFRVAHGFVLLDQPRKARKELMAMTEKFPALSGPWVALGQIAEKSEKYDDAVKNYRKAIGVNRNNVNAYIALGLLQRRQGHFAEAQKAYVDALNVWSDFPEAHLNLAILYDLYLNKPEQAQKHYEAYDFLTGHKDQKVHKWLVEVKQRTGIETSFIDIPPKKLAGTPGGKSAPLGVVAKSGGEE